MTGGCNIRLCEVLQFGRRRPFQRRADRVQSARAKRGERDEERPSCVRFPESHAFADRQ
jgi:hypothetical protein